MLMFLVVGAFGLMTMLFIGSTTHAPVMVPPPAPAPMPGALPDDATSSEGRRVPPSYEHRWDESERDRDRPPYEWHERDRDWHR